MAEITDNPKPSEVAAALRELTEEIRTLGPKLDETTSAMNGRTNEPDADTIEDARQEGREQMAHTLEHALTWAGYGNFVKDIDAAVERWDAAGRPTEGHETR